MNDEQQRAFVEAAKRLLDAAADDLDGTVMSRLHRARNRALMKAGPRPLCFRRPLPLIGTIASALVAAVLVVFVARGPSGQEMVEKNMVADLGLFTAEESLEFFEDIDFYEWLSTAEEAENSLSRAFDGLPGPGPCGLGQGPDTGDHGRGAGDGDAGVSRII